MKYFHFQPKNSWINGQKIVFCPSVRHNEWLLLSSSKCTLIFEGLFLLGISNDLWKITSFQATLNGVTGVGSAAIEPVGPPGNQKLSIKRTNIDFDIASANVQMENLFDGRAPGVARTVNDFINQNSGLIINEVKPQIRDQVTQLVESVMNDAFSKLPADDFLKHLPPHLVPQVPRARPPPPSGGPLVTPERRRRRMFSH